MDVTTIDITTSASNDTTIEPQIGTDFMDRLWLRIIFVILYVVIFILGLAGNLLVVYVVIRSKSMQTITNIFIANLALSDVMMCLLAVPFTPISAFMKNWVFGEFLCHLVPMTLGVSVYVSTLTSTAIAADRYFVIVHPFKPRIKTGICLGVIVAIWLVAISISLPLGIYAQVKFKETEGTFNCQEHWPKHTARQFFTVTSLVLQYMVPCAIICHCYVQVSKVLKSRSRSRIGTGTRNRERDEMEINRKRRTNRMLIAVISIFVICWLPLNIILIVTEYNIAFQAWSYYYLVFFTGHVVAMSSTIYNPFLYAWMNDNFRKEFNLVLPGLLRGGKPRHRNGQSTTYTNVDPHSLHANRHLDRNGPHSEISVNADATTEIEMKPLRPEDD